MPAFYIMDKNIYLSSGYFNVEYVLRFPAPFIFVVGGRGTGKTYGALRYVLENHIKFIYMRRMQAQADIINKPEFSPFKSVMRDTGQLITSMPVTKYNSAFYLAKLEDDKLIPDGAPIGYTMALSTVSNLRGFDMSDCTLLIYDEFIPEQHERPLKNEAAALFNAYETINRNRELTGSQALKVLCLANANTLNNPIFASLGVMDKVLTMEKKQQAVTINADRGYAIVMLSGSPVSRQKKNTALYALTQGTEFSRMAIDNSYNVQFTRQAVNLVEYAPLFVVDGVAVYRHKAGSGLYVTRHISGGIAEIDARLYKKLYAAMLSDLDARGLVIYEDIALKECLTHI